MWSRAPFWPISSVMHRTGYFLTYCWASGQNSSEWQAHMYMQSHSKNKVTRQNMLTDLNTVWIELHISFISITMTKSDHSTDQLVLSILFCLFRRSVVFDLLDLWAYRPHIHDTLRNKGSKIFHCHWSSTFNGTSLVTFSTFNLNRLRCIIGP